ncbi:MAG: copper homeostasis membrane protein CopD [Alphaproteobacteria bacterium]|nr:copper homeostasis membrane protein CopD [Alphaproteobacteria bacterium]
MTDWLGVALRFGVYADLLLLFGLAAYPLYAASPSRPLGGRLMIAGVAGLGLLLSILSFLQTVASMARTTIAGVDRETFDFVLFETPPGDAFLWRTASLAIALVAALLRSAKIRSPMVALGAGVALGTLAWTGHAAVTEGAAGTIHRLADGLHLLAAGAWLGALAVLVTLLFARIEDDRSAASARSALAGFAVAGSIIVAVIVATGLINVWMIVGVEGALRLPTTLYGQLLIAKLLLFAAMLGLATVNRWRLTPRLALRDAGSASGGVRALRVSIALETSAAVLILALVAWLGTLSPQPTM